MILSSFLVLVAVAASQHAVPLFVWSDLEYVERSLIRLSAARRPRSLRVLPFPRFSVWVGTLAPPLRYILPPPSPRHALPLTSVQPRGWRELRE